MNKIYNLIRTNIQGRRLAILSVMLFALICQDVVSQITIPAANTNTSSNRKPFGGFYGFERTTSIYTEAEHGVPVGSSISSIAFYVNSVNAASNVPVVIYMSNTSSTAFVASTFASEIVGATQVYAGTITAASLVANTWITIPLTTPFVNTGNNLKVMIEANAGGSGNEGSAAKQFRMSAGASQNWNADNTAPIINGTVSTTSRPNMQIAFTTPVGPGTVEFSNATYNGNEGNSVVITVKRVGGQDGAISVNYATSNGTATSGLDYTATSGTLNWANGDLAAKTFTVSLASDLVVDAAEVINLTLSSPVGTTISGTNPATLIIKDVPPPFTGVITVGTGGNFTSLTNVGGAFEALNLSGAGSNLVINIVSDLTAETGAVALNEIAGGFTTTIKPSGAARLISSASAGATIKLNAADGVTIDGALGLGSTRDLTLENTSTGAVIWIASTTTNGALNNIIKNTNISGNALATAQGIIVSGSVYGSAAEVSNNDLIINNNTFKKVQNGVFAIGNALTPDQNWTISNNIAGSAIAEEKITFRGFAVQNVQNFTISGNQVFGVTNAGTNTVAGILVGVNASNGNIFSNKISDIKNTNAGGYGSLGIYLNSINATANINTYNNFISDVSSVGYAAGATAADNAYGIFVGSGAGYGIYNNSVAMNTSQTNASLSAALNVGVGVTVAGAVNVRNNIFTNTQAQAGEKYVIYSAAPSSVFAAMDYNNYFSSGSNLAFIGSPLADISAIQTGFGQNTASKNIAPVFISATDLHLDPVNNPTLDNLGTPIATVITDIDGAARSATTPDMGADEFTDLFVNKFDLSNGFNAYPNPVSSVLNIEYTSDLTNVSVFNMLGQQVITKNVSATTTQIDMSGLTNGTYMIKVEAGNVSKTIKVFKK